MERLENTRWGFESNCFVCEDRNEAGLRIPFFHDAAAGEVVADFRLDDRFSGAPSYVHGGVVLAILDEAMAWATIAICGSFAVTRETTTRFERPIRADRAHQVRARAREEGHELVCEATVVDDRGRDCAVARAVFTPLGPAQAVDAIGAELNDSDSTYLRSP